MEWKLTRRGERKVSTVEELCVEYMAWNKANGLDLGSAEEHLFDESLTAEQQDWLADFCKRWQAAVDG